MRWGMLGGLAIGVLMLVTCGGTNSKPVENLVAGHDVSRFRLTSIRGIRDGDQLDVRAVYGDGTAELRVALRFRVGVPTRLENGTWTGFASGGSVRERTVTFLGGQSGPPSLGGRFDLLGPDNVPRYRISIPLQPLRDRL